MTLFEIREKLHNRYKLSDYQITNLQTGQGFLLLFLFFDVNRHTDYRDPNQLIRAGTSLVIKRLNPRIKPLRSCEPATEVRPTQRPEPAQSKAEHKEEQDEEKEWWLHYAPDEERRMQDIHRVLQLRVQGRTSNKQWEARKCRVCGGLDHPTKKCRLANEPGFEAPKRQKRTTGIPSSHLVYGPGQAQEPTQPAAAAPQTITHVPDEAAFRRHYPRAEMREPRSTAPMGLTCNLCDGLFREPATTQCCFSTFCSECFQQRIAEDSSCPVCGTADPSLQANHGLLLLPFLCLGMLCCVF